MRSERHEELFNKYFGDFYPFLKLSIDERLEFDFQTCSDSDALVGAIFGGKNGHPISNKDGNPITSELGDKISKYRGMLETKIKFENLNGDDRFKDSLRFQSTEDSITSEVKNIMPYERLYSLIQELDRIYWDESVHINGENMNGLYNELASGLEKIRNRSLSESDWNRYLELPVGNEEITTYLKNKKILI